jgi:hypothetical protein
MRWVATPTLHVYTAARSTTWPDLSASHVNFPADAEYSVGIVGIGVFASIDELTGPGGFASTAPRELRRSYLEPVKVHVLR